jgi:hypothetical protein
MTVLPWIQYNVRIHEKIPIIRTNGIAYTQSGDIKAYARLKTSNGILYFPQERIIIQESSQLPPVLLSEANISPQANLQGLRIDDDILGINMLKLRIFTHKQSARNGDHCGALKT